jgi:hypothetical protein
MEEKEYLDHRSNDEKESSVLGQKLSPRRNLSPIVSVSAEGGVESGNLESTKEREPSLYGFERMSPKRTDLQVQCREQGVT